MVKKPKPATKASVIPGDRQPFQVSKVEFVVKLDAFIARANLLAEALKTAIQLQAISGPGLWQLQQHLDQFEQARWGDERD